MSTIRRHNFPAGEMPDGDTFQAIEDAENDWQGDK